MKLKTILSLALVIGIAAAVFYQGDDRQLSNPVSAQIGGGCGSFTAASYPCGNNETCGTGEYTSTAAFYNGPGINGQELRDVNCQGTSCGNVENVSTAYFNGYCCDQDNDGFEKTSCGGTDCNDDNYNINPGRPELCDSIDNNCNGQIDENCPTPTPEPTPTECPDNGDQWVCNQIHGQWHPFPECYCDEGSPIVIDINGDGFNLTSQENGVYFDLNGDGTVEHWSWTAGDSDEAWLALDRNGDGIINNGQELFGNFTPQPTPPAGTIPNGFLALADYDRTATGGNEDGRINRRDAVFSSLRLWQDTNHNGISEANELHTLPDLGLRRIDLDYRESRRTDEHGNRFKYRAKVRDAQDAQLGRWAWDVFLIRGTP